MLIGKHGMIRLNKCLQRLDIGELRRDKFRKNHTKGRREEEKKGERERVRGRGGGGREGGWERESNTMQLLHQSESVVYLKLLNILCSVSERSGSSSPQGRSTSSSPPTHSRSTSSSELVSDS